MSIVSYMEGLPLAGLRTEASPFKDLDKAFARRSTFKRVGVGSPNPELATAIPDDLKAAVNAGSILSFVDGVGHQETADILSSVQLAQRGASASFDRFAQTQSWYQKYIEILENLGWVGEQFGFAHTDLAEGEFRMDKAALGIIMAIATQNQLMVLTRAVEALGTLAEGDGTIQLFDYHAASSGSGNFQIGSVQKSENGVLSLALGAFYFRSLDNRRKFLFFRWGVQEVNFWTAAQKMTFNTSFYAQYRDLVNRKLGASATSFVSSLNLLDK